MVQNTILGPGNFK